jgi:hypothetical protein
MNNNVANSNNTGLQVNTEPKMTSLSIKVLRANGKVEDYGLVSYTHRNKFIQWFYQKIVINYYAIKRAILYG